MDRSNEGWIANAVGHLHVRAAIPAWTGLTLHRTSLNAQRPANDEERRMSVATRIVLTGSSPTLEGLSWESESSLRIGRQGTNDIVLQDPSVGRVQAEVRNKGSGWVLQQFAHNPRSPSYVNGRPIEGEEIHLRLHDVLQFGRVTITVTALESEEGAEPERRPSDTPLPNAFRTLPGVGPDSLQWPTSEPPAPASGQSPLEKPNDPYPHLKTSNSFVRIQETTHRTYDQALEAIASRPMSSQHQSQHVLTLLRAGYHLCHIASLDELLRSILSDTIQALDAQRGSIVLTTTKGELRLSAKLSKVPNDRTLGFSRTLAQRCFGEGQSLLCQDAAMESVISSVGSVRRGAMASIICAVLRSPRKRLGVIHLDRGPFQEPFSTHDFYLADAIAASVSVGIESALMVEQQREEFIQSVTSLARTVELRDQYTGDHTRRVTDYSLLLARELKLSPTEIDNVEIGTPLHDIGKIGVDDAILRKPGRLTSNEFEIMKTHTVKGAEILNTMTNLSPMIPIVRHHHEKWDGSGYPDGLGAQKIPRIARVVAVTDAFDAMTSDRPYRKALSASKAFEELHKGAGSHFDPQCVEAFLNVREKVVALLRS